MLIGAVLNAGSAALGFAKYVNLVEDKIEQRLIALANSEFDAGFRALQQAARSEVERDTLLREARSRFNKAISLETGYRLAMAHLGLALCHGALGDRCNANVAFLELASLDRLKFVGFWSRTIGRKPDAELLDIQREVREYLFSEYRYAVPINDGVYDFRLLRDA